jgi:transcriptional regulator with GAF, ATPase, and Fis domain
MNAKKKQLRQGAVVGKRYQVEHALEGTGPGDGYVCLDLINGGARVAIRMLTLSLQSSASNGEISGQLSLLRRFRHPNLARVVDFGVSEESDELFLIYEWNPGKDFLAATARMGAEEGLRWIIEVCSAIQYLHARGVSHGDLNPSSIMFSVDSAGKVQLKVSNYGLSAMVEGLSRESAALGYAAPEILLGERANKSSDIYSMGVLIYQLLTRRLPFEDEDPDFLVQKHLQSEVDLRPIARIRGGRRISSLVKSLLDKDPALRPRSAEDIIQCIREALGLDCQEANIKDLENRLGASRCVGRTAELSRVKKCADRVKDTRRGWTVFVTGEAGSGKTRYLEELGIWALLNGWHVVQGTCGVRDEGSYEPYRQILANSSPVGGKVLFSFDNKLRESNPGTLESSPEYAAGQYRDLLTRELVRRLSDRPTLLMLHDFHLADEATSSVLDYLSADIQAYPVLMCVSLRSGGEVNGSMERVLDSTIKHERGEIITVEPLDRESAEQMVENVTGDSRLKVSLGAWIYESVGGNPFFLEEMLKHLVEQKILRYESGEWTFANEDLSQLEVPASVGAVLLRRLQSLQPDARQMANWLALFRGVVPRSLLSSVISQNEQFVAGGLKELAQRQMIRTEVKRSEEMIGFSHSLIAEVIRGDLSKSTRSRMHLKIAGALEKAAGSEGRVHELAAHYMEGNGGAVAVRYALASAEQARMEFAHDRALPCFEYVFKKRGGLSGKQICLAAIEASDTMFALGLPKRSIQMLKGEIGRNKDVETELKARMYMQLALSYQHLGDLRMQEWCCRKGLSYFRNRSSSGTDMTRSMLWAELAFASILQSRLKRGLSFLEKARRSCPAQNASALEGRIYNMTASVHRIACNLQQARRASEKAAEILNHSNESHLECSALSMLGIILQALGRFSLALEKHKQAVILSHISRSVVLISQSLGNLVECLCRMGRTQEAVNTAERAAKSVWDTNSLTITYAFTAILAETKVAAGDFRGALDAVRRLDREAKLNQAKYTLGHALYAAASLYFVLGRFDLALNYVNRVCKLETPEAPFYERELAEAIKARILFEQGEGSKALSLLETLDRKAAEKHWPYQRCIIKLHLCEILLRQNRFESVKPIAGQALRLALAMQSDSLEAQAHLLLGLAYASDACPEEFLHQSGRRDVAVDAADSFGRAMVELNHACHKAESSLCVDTIWRTHAALSFLYKSGPEDGKCLAHAERAYEHLCRIEDQVPSEMLPSFRDAFGRSRAKAELVQLIEMGRENEAKDDLTVAEVRDEDKARILLRMSATLGSVRELGPLLEAIIDQLIPAVKMENAYVFLKDELTGGLQLAKGRTDRRGSISSDKGVDRHILMDVLKRGKPFVSADAQKDSRISERGRVKPAAAGKILCAPLKLSDHVLGVLYADHSSPAESLSESVISLFAAFCNLAAMAIENALAHHRALKEKTELEGYLNQDRDGYEEIVGKSDQVELLRDRIGVAARSPMDILIIGESGTGKELVARAIHRTGGRKGCSFIAVDCGSLTDNLAEAELFGFRKGAFTGAAENHQGLLESAHGGMLFLDEILNLPLHVQAKFLRVLQEREVRRIGETVPRKIDIQVIAATNKDLREEVKSGRFREDLFYRLKVMEIRVPALRERSDDIALLVEWFMAKAAELGGGVAKKIEPDAMDLLKKYSYPGNIRELKNMVTSCYFSTHKTSLGVADLPTEVSAGKHLLHQPQADEAEQIYSDIVDGKGDFEALVRKPFSQRKFGSPIVCDVIRKALRDSAGRYREALLILRVPERRYSVTMQFLKRNHCCVDFRPFRKNRPSNS